MSMYPFCTFLGRKIPTYGIFMVLAICVVFLLSKKNAKKQGLLFADLLIVGAFSLLLALPCGATTYAFVTFGFDGVWMHLANGDFSVFGGLVFYGALLGGIAGAIVGIKVAGVPILSVEKTIIPFLPIGHAIGRIGCVLAGCCYGMEYNGIFSIAYPHSVTEQRCFPIQFLEGFFNLLVALLLIRLSRNNTRTFRLLSWYLLLYGIVRFFMEFLRGDTVRGIFYSFSTSQWISVALCMGSALYLTLTKKKTIAFKEK